MGTNSNSVICPVTLVFPKQPLPDRRGKRRKMTLSFTSADLRACLELTRHTAADPDGRTVLGASIEAYLRRLLTHCAFRIHIPAFAHPAWHPPSLVKSLLAPSTRKHVVFVDRRGVLWDAICEFLLPVWQAADDHRCVSNVAWDLYMLVLATRHKGEVVVSPERFIANVAKLDRSSSMSAEARARLARLAGLFQLFDAERFGPSLRLRAGVGARTVSWRIAEILEDGYLLEASQLRRMFGVKQNVASIKRDLRKLLGFIARSRPWARGLVSLSSIPLTGGDSGLRVLDALLDMLPVMQGSVSQPVLARYDTSLDFATEGCVRMIRKISGDWVYRIE